MNIVVILNYVVRIMTIVLGVLITIKPWDSNGNSSLVQAFGVATIAFGLFRLYIYHRRLQELKRQEEQTHSENEHDDEETME